MDLDMAEAEKSAQEMDQVYKLLVSLDSKDKDERDKAQRDIDAYLEEKQRRSKEEQLYGEIVAGCKKVKSKTVINTKESEALKRKRLSDEYKRQGNEHFAKEEFKRAHALYTSAILQDDANPALFTNRAQASIKLERHDDAIEDCKRALKLSPESVKAHIHLARALKGKGQFQKAIDVLEVAEDASLGYAEVIKEYKQGIIKAMKEQLLEEVKK